jgi:hypothetical protein
VHKKFKLARDLLRATAPPIRVFSPYIPRNVFEGPTESTLEWIRTVTYVGV